MSASPIEEYDFPYEAGSIVTVQARGTEDLNLKVIRHFKPFTLSVVMVVDILHDDNSTTRAVLKMFDWRFCTQSREESDMAPWSDEHARAYSDFVNSGAADVDRYDDCVGYDECVGHPQDELSLAEKEVDFMREQIRWHETEMETYAALEDCQGKQIPRLWDWITLRFPLDKRPGGSQSDHFYHVRGLVLEFIDGFTLDHLPKNAPSEYWQAIVDEAIKVCHIISDHNVLNYDVRLPNIVVVFDQSNPQYEKGFKVVFVDFGCSRIRGIDEDDFFWGHEKYTVNEEGGIGDIMVDLLEAEHFRLYFKSSGRYDEFALGARPGRLYHSW